MKAWGSHLASRSDRVNLLLGPDDITFGVDVELCSETEWSKGDVGGDSQSDALLGRFGRFVLLVEGVTHLCCRGKSLRSGPKQWWTHKAKSHERWMDTKFQREAALMVISSLAVG